MKQITIKYGKQIWLCDTKAQAMKVLIKLNSDGAIVAKVNGLPRTVQNIVKGYAQI